MASRSFLSRHRLLAWGTGHRVCCLEIQHYIRAMKHDCTEYPDLIAQCVLVDSPWLSGLCNRVMLKILSTENGETPQWILWLAFLHGMYFITACVLVC